MQKQGKNFPSSFCHRANQLQDAHHHAGMRLRHTSGLGCDAGSSISAPLSNKCILQQTPKTVY